MDSLWTLKTTQKVSTRVITPTRKPPRQHASRAAPQQLAIEIGRQRRPGHPPDLYISRKFVTRRYDFRHQTFTHDKHSPNAMQPRVLQQHSPMAMRRQRALHCMALPAAPMRAHNGNFAPPVAREWWVSSQARQGGQGSAGW